MCRLPYTAPSPCSRLCYRRQMLNIIEKRDYAVYVAEMYEEELLDSLGFTPGGFDVQKYVQNLCHVLSPNRFKDRIGLLKNMDFSKNLEWVSALFFMIS